MNEAKPAVTPFWRTVRLLLGTARLRARNRNKLARQLLSKPGGGGFGGLALFGTAIVFLWMALVQGLFAVSIDHMVDFAVRIDVENRGTLVVSDTFLKGVFGPDAVDKPDIPAASPSSSDINAAVKDEAGRRTRDLGGTDDAHAALLQRQIKAHGRGGFISRHKLPDFFELPEPELMQHELAESSLVRLVGALGLLAWFVMVTCQGEGMQVDFQRRRHPMWEWLLSHPIQPGAAFFSEFFAPWAANPVYLTSPVFCFVVLDHYYPVAESMVAGLAIGLAVALAASCLNKTIEIGAMLRLSPRTRGAVLGIMSWLGFSMLMAGMLVLGDQDMIKTMVPWLQPVSQWISVPILPWALGAWAGGGLSLFHAVMAGLAFAAVMTAVCVSLSARATNRGLQGGFDGPNLNTPVLKGFSTFRFMRDPLRKKELLWFSRDRGAVVQVILIPLTVGLLQAANLRHVTGNMSMTWNSMCGLAIICGTYFLLILGPQSLVSEGPALWLALTWPLGLESLLKAKARLWGMIASGVVGLILAFVVFRFPTDAWKVALVAGGWWMFSRGLAEKSVTLVTAPSSAGERKPSSAGRQWSVMLGTFSFAAGVFSQNWHLACLGVVYSSLTAAAMWQNFRARVPFLFDPWSEKLPTPPTLMHAMIAIMCMLDGMSLIIVPLSLIVGADGMTLTIAVAYGVAGCLAWFFTNKFLTGRGVSARQVWFWEKSAPASGVSMDDSSDGVRSVRFVKAVLTGLAGGVLLGVVALVYMGVIWHIPMLNQSLIEQSRLLAEHPGDKYWLAIMAIGMAPFAEEYMFRGLLFRALDREWGGWRAIIGSALFFGVYHQPLSWVPVIALGIFNAWLFKRTGSLIPCVIAHMAYNTMVTLVS